MNAIFNRLGIDYSNKILHYTVKFDGFEIDKAEDLMKMVQIPCYELLTVVTRVYACQVLRRDQYLSLLQRTNSNWT